MSYVQHLSRRNTPQTEALPGQVKNSGGGYTFKLDPFGRLKRFLILGCEGGTYYASERTLTKENAQCVLECAGLDPVRTVSLIHDVSVQGRAPKNDAAVFALALLASSRDFNTSKAALDAMPAVCRTGTHLFQFVEAVNELRGWGRGLRTGVANWYLQKEPDHLAMQVTKYAQRNGWSHRDVLRLCHPKTKNRALQDVLQYVAQREKWLKSKRAGHRLLVTVEEAKTASVKNLCKWIREEGLVREHIPTERLNEPAIWEALLQHMPATAMLRNLGKMTNIGLLAPLSASTREVCARLRSQDFLKKGRIHPFSVLLALTTYQQGRGVKGSLTWKPDQQVVAALNDAYYLSFGSVTPTGKRFYLGIDCSASMTWASSRIANTHIFAREAAACMAMVAMRTEPQSYIAGFSSDMLELPINARSSLNDVVHGMGKILAGATDCSAPMRHAAREKIEADVFCIYTDNETNCRREHPHVALETYRQKMGIDAKLVVFGMTATPFTIADPNDPGMLDVCGFDSAAPEVVSEFVRG